MSDDGEALVCDFCGDPGTYLLCNHGAFVYRWACGACRVDPAILARFGPNVDVIPLAIMIHEKLQREAGIPTLPLYENGPPGAEAPHGPPA